MLTSGLLEAIGASEMNSAVNFYDKLLEKGEDPWDIHLSLFPAVQPILNPPFINPHLPKMYAVIREFISYLKKEDLPALIRIEITEYAKRPKFKKSVKSSVRKRSVSFSDIETAISNQDIELTANALKAFLYQKGAIELSRNLLLLGSGYLNDSLGHSFSCTAFILLEMLSRPQDNPWPVLVGLADYFCKGRFYTMPPVISTDRNISGKILEKELLRATAGYGIVNLHHTITLYAIERTRHLFNVEVYQYLLQAGIGFMGIKDKDSRKIEPADTVPSNYKHFYGQFSKKDLNSTLPTILTMMRSQSNRRRLGRYLIKGLCDHYQGNYNPHYLTGLGSTLWIIENYWNSPNLISAALGQYLDFYFDGI